MRNTRRAVSLLAAVVTVTGTVAAQAPAHTAPWHTRIAIGVHTGRLTLSGGGEALELFNRALDPGIGGLHPTLRGGMLRVRVASRWAVHAGTESGERTSASTSRVQPAGVTSPVAQSSQFALRRAWHAGAEWQAWQLGHGAGDAAARLFVGVGVGAATYGVHQWGTFVDADRLVAFDGDFRSAGHGTIGYGSLAIDLGLLRGLSVRGEIRRQFGSATMDADFSAFDRIDLGGTRLGVGMLVAPTALLGIR